MVLKVQYVQDHPQNRRLIVQYFGDRPQIAICTVDESGDHPQTNTQCSMRIKYNDDSNIWYFEDRPHKYSRTAAGAEYEGRPPCACASLVSLQVNVFGSTFLRTAGRPYAFHVGMKCNAVAKIRISPVWKMFMKSTLKFVLKLFRI